ncbi:hypothetical protein V5799_027955 [Amblyomma americanum]|uniref:Uncharacterized protein n=1 Tax=Amblyomma americanum TaxID=6943 RepID=A0AAQ4DE88_AMBAM
MSTTTKYTETTTTTQKPLSVNSLICAVTEHLTRQWYEYPADGLCAIIFYDSLYHNPNNTLEQPHHDLFQYFLDSAGRHTITEYGIGFDFS